MKKSIPSQFLTRLNEILGKEAFEKAGEYFLCPKIYSFRINTLKNEPNNVFEALQKEHVAFERISWCEYAFVVKEKNEILSQMADQGMIYQQSLSSMFVPLVLDPKQSEDILDLCAAPGSKSTQMAAIVKNEGKIVCVEAVKGRFFKLKSVINLLGVKNIQCQLTDGRRFEAKGNAFDKILLDAPCSSEGRFHTSNPESWQYWSVRKIKEMEKKQKGLLLNAFRQLKKGGTLVYSTCTFAPEENEGVVDWLCRKMPQEMEIVDIALPAEIKKYPARLEWNARRFDARLQKCVRILPDATMGAFFIAKIKKIA